ncbi:NUDIX hydrolase [Agrobacterium tumefaciens]|uniref:NUDIX hydrolase n=1 Tax=Agrobacterium tumefaciens TaxID=358 RepID=UPI000DCFE9D0|nr:NUDIX hydrolase [Agrobacterium tumefaciens]MBP2537044.1 acetyl-CoA carboxylase carboxyl transferase subunit beta [Agrobacterium tumefaciens]MDP9790916.1 acetyl-CoA carboxylase carboxyl transferase subunit beta [Agrobacterium tumefaciens]
MVDQTPTLAASAVVLDGQKRILLVQRANPPDKGCWTLPGGRVDPGETLELAAISEIFEETGLVVRIVRELGKLHVPDGKGGIYEIHDFLAEKISGEASAGDDAAAIGWFRNDELSKLPLTPDLLHYLNLYGVYP